MTPRPVRAEVAAALKELSEEAAPVGPFRFWVSAAQVASRAGVSESAARRHLKELSVYRGYRNRLVAGRQAYRYDQ